MLQLRNLFGPARAQKSVHVRSLSHANVSGSVVTKCSKAQADVIEQGSALFAEGDFAQALALLDNALDGNPREATLLFARGSTLFAWGRFHEALQCFEQARDAGLLHIDLDLQLGWTCLYLQHWDQSIAHFRNAVDREPDSEAAWTGLANGLETRGILALEAAEFARKLSRWPKNYDALMLFAACRIHLGDIKGGVEVFRDAISLDPSRSRAWSNLGVTLGWERRYREGLECLRRALEIDKRNGTNDSILNLATCLIEEDHRREALDLLEQSLVSNPDPMAHWLRSAILLECGHWNEAWAQHEFRWMKEPLVSRRWTMRSAVWDGQDLHGKTIVVHAEQGFGDAIQFIRYARLLKQLGARVIFDAFKDFDEISHDFDDVDEVAREGPMPKFDFRIPLLSLPRVFGTAPHSIPAHVPYVKVHGEQRERWASRFQQSVKLKVGLVWAGNPKHLRDRMRSIPLVKLTPLAHLDGVELYSLQKGGARDDIAKSGMKIIDLGRDLDTFRDTAAVISHLDLVISVDTSVAHLAGALAKPVWMMIAKPSDWRWLLQGDTTAWYPTMRLFRQAQRDEWESVVEAVADALQDVILERHGEPQSPALGLRAWDDSERVSATTVDCDLDAIGKGPFCLVCETRYGIVEFPQGPEELARSLRYYGEHRHVELELMRRFVGPGGRVLDAGCGVATSTLLLSETVGEAGHIIAYESDRFLYQIAAHNLAANRVRNVTLLNRPLGAKPGTDQTLARSRPGNDADSIDGLRLPKLDWVRIGPAQNALEILGGASDTLWRLRPWVFVAVESGTFLPDLAKLVRDWGYQPWQFDAPLFNPDNHNGRTDDIFQGGRARGLLCVPEEVEVDVGLSGCTPVNTDS